jgi:hypothetical protein
MAPSAAPTNPVAHARAPTGAALMLLVHVQPQRFDEQHLGKLGQHARAARPRRARLGERITQRHFEPDTGVRSADVDAHADAGFRMPAEFVVVAARVG